MRVTPPTLPLLSIALLLSMTACHSAHLPSGSGHKHPDLSVVPAHERAIAQHRSLEGPTKTHGIADIETLVSLHLGDEFSAMEGQSLRARVLLLEPGAVVAVHQHERRPGFALILEGEMVEHRNDHEGPITRRVGDVAVERTGVSHWWENRSGQVVRALVVDVVPQAP